MQNKSKSRGSQSRARAGAAGARQQSDPAVPMTTSVEEPSSPTGDGASIVPYARLLRERQREPGKKRKGERTRDSLKLAAVEVLSRVGYHDLRVSDICDRAGASHAAFYLYFRHKKDITRQILTEFLDEVFVQARSIHRRDTPFEAFYHTNLAWIRATRANAGLARCILQLNDDTPDFKKLNEHNGYQHFLRVARTIAKRFLRAEVDEKVLLLTVYALGSMMDDLSRRLLVSRDPHLRKLVDSVTPTDESLAEFLTMLWYRGLFGTDAHAAKRSVGRELEKIAAARKAVAGTTFDDHDRTLTLSSKP